MGKGVGGGGGGRGVGRKNDKVAIAIAICVGGLAEWEKKQQSCNLWGGLWNQTWTWEEK